MKQQMILVLCLIWLIAFYGCEDGGSGNRMPTQCASMTDAEGAKLQDLLDGEQSQDSRVGKIREWLNEDRGELVTILNAFVQRYAHLDFLMQEAVLALGKIADKSSIEPLRSMLKRFPDAHWPGKLLTAISWSIDQCEGHN